MEGAMLLLIIVWFKFSFQYLLTLPMLYVENCTGDFMI